MDQYNSSALKLLRWAEANVGRQALTERTKGVYVYAKDIHRKDNKTTHSEIMSPHRVWL